MTNPRIAKLEDQIQEIVARMLERRIKDPRLGFVTITDVRVTGDAREATIFYTEMPQDSDDIDTPAALESAKGLLRSTVSKQLGMKFVPSLAFVRDAIAETAQDMEDLLARVQAADAELAQVRAGAEYAGEADPYRKPGEDDPDPDPAETDATLAEEQPELS